MAGAGQVDPTAYVSTVTNQAEDEWNKANTQYKWAQDQFAGNKATSDTVTQQALNTGANFGDWATQDRGDYDTNVRPAMQQQMDFARGYTTDARMAANRASAIGGANLASDAAADNAKSSLMSYGVDPSSGRYAGLDAGLAAKRAMTAAGAGTTSDRNTEMLGQQYLANAIKTGQVLPGQAMNEAATGMAADNQAVNAGLATTASGASTMGLPTQWAGLGDNMIQQWNSAEDKSAALDQSQEKIDQSQSSGIGAMIGGGLGVLGSVVSMIPGGQVAGPIMSMAGGAASKMASQGGRITRYAAGGMAMRDGDNADEEDLGTTNGILDYTTGDSFDNSDEVPYDSDYIPPQHDDTMQAAHGGEVTSGVSDAHSVPAHASPSRGQKTDDVHAMVQVGEFIMPEDVSRWYGEKYFQGLIEKARKDMTLATAKPEPAVMPQAMAISPPAFRSEGARE